MVLQDHCAESYKGLHQLPQAHLQLVMRFQTRTHERGAWPPDVQEATIHRRFTAPWYKHVVLTAGPGPGFAATLHGGFSPCLWTRGTPEVEGAWLCRPCHMLTPPLLGGLLSLQWAHFWDGRNERI